MPHGGGYQEPLVHPGLTREAEISGERLVISGVQRPVKLLYLIARHSPLP